MRSSHTHPLQIAEIAAPAGGLVGVTFCPGKHQPSAATGAWARDLEVDADAIGAWGADIVITLVTPAELNALKVEGLGRTLRSRGIRWLHLPIEDVSVPTAEWEQAWLAARDEVHAILGRAGRVLVHCKGGLGRAGMVAALILVERGDTPQAALRKVRAARSPLAVETPQQELYVLRHAPPYELEDHRHNVAVWAATRAAQRGHLGFDVRSAKAAIDACDLRRFATVWQALPDRDEFDDVHAGWREQAAGQLECSLGRAAKLINMYLKLMVVCGPAGVDPSARAKVGAIHPPIDRQLLTCLALRCADGEELIRDELLRLRDRGWTHFDSGDYQAAVDAIRAWLAERGQADQLWRAEQCWKGF